MGGPLNEALYLGVVNVSSMKVLNDNTPQPLQETGPPFLRSILGHVRV